MKYFSGTPLLSRLMALATNTKLGWKGLPKANTLAYYEHSKIADIKTFKTFGPRPML
jgi:hypothetical protein